MVTNALGIYEKALPRGLSWEQTFDLVHELGYNFLEFSVDESDERLARLDWTEHDRARFRDAMWRTHSRINTMMLSGHRRFPLGSKDPEVREKALDMMRKAIDLAVDLASATSNSPDTTCITSRKPCCLANTSSRTCANVSTWPRRNW